MLNYIIKRQEQGVEGKKQDMGGVVLLYFVVYIHI
jgi:hypothetical protein